MKWNALKAGDFKVSTAGLPINSVYIPSTSYELRTSKVVYRSLYAISLVSLCRTLNQTKRKKSLDRAQEGMCLGGSSK